MAAVQEHLNTRARFANISLHAAMSAAEHLLHMELATRCEQAAQRMYERYLKLDDVLGIVYVKDVARRVHEQPEARHRDVVDDVMRPAQVRGDIVQRPTLDQVAGRDVRAGRA